MTDKERLQAVRQATIKGKPLVYAADRDKWDRQPGETPKMYDRFAEFRDMGRTRTLKRLAEKLNRSVRTLQQYSHEYSWTDRAHAYDQHMDAQWRNALAENSRRMVQEHLKVGRALLSKVQQRLETMEPEDLSPQDCDRWLNTYSKLSRVALGEPESTVALTGGPAGTPISFTQVPSDENTRQAQMETALTELARRLHGGDGLDAEAILGLES